MPCNCCPKAKAIQSRVHKLLTFSLCNGLLESLIYYAIRSSTKHYSNVSTLEPFFKWCSFLLGKAVGEMILFFGCRKKTEDYIYEDELLSYSQDGTIEQLHVAFSRDQVSFLGFLRFLCSMFLIY